MNTERLAFVGGGRIVRILLAGWKRANFPVDNVAVLEPDESVAQRLQASFPQVRLCDNVSSLMANASALILAVHPPQVLPTLESAASLLPSGTLVISLAPKITLAQMAARLPTHCPCCRVLPNAPSLVDQGFNPIAFAEGWSDADRARVTNLFAPLGENPSVPEEHLEAYALLTAMGPTYFWFQWKVLEELGQQLGLPTEVVRHGIDSMLRGAARTYFDAGLSPEESQDLIPVHPLREHVPEIEKFYRNSLTSLYQKIRPQIT